MHSGRLTSLLLLAGTLIAAQPAVGEPYVIDKSHAHVTFQAGHLGFSTVHGQFRKFDAQIDFDSEQVERTSVVFTVDMASVETFWEARDADLRGPNFFDVERYPTMTFVSTEVRPTGAETAEVRGDLTIKDTTRSVVFQATLNKLGPSPFDPSRTVAGFSIEGVIDRTEFGMSFAAPAVSALIPIRIDLEMSPAR